MDKQLSILTVNFNTADFIIHALPLLAKITHNQYDVFILDNGSRLTDYNQLKKYTDQFANIFLERWETDLRDSLAHGTALNHLVAKVKTPYFSVLDSDALWLKKNWDEVLISHLNNKIKIIGTEARGIKKPSDFPLMYAILFETETFKNLNVDFRPQDLTKHEDTGFALRNKYLSAGYQGETLKLKNTREYKHGPLHRCFDVDEYYLAGDKHIFATHFGRGSNAGAFKYKKTWKGLIYRHLRVIGPHLLRVKGEKEKTKWFNLCSQIVNNQS